MKVEVLNSAIAGRGSFAMVDIRPGEEVFTFIGEIVSRAEIYRRVAVGIESLGEALQVGDDRFMDVSKSNHLFVNHNCNPNAGIREVSQMFALKDINAGEEVTFDYSTTVGEDDVDDDGIPWSMECNCGAVDCRGVIGNYLTIPESDLMRYYRLGALPYFIKSKVEAKM